MARAGIWLLALQLDGARGLRLTQDSLLEEADPPPLYGHKYLQRMDDDCRNPYATHAWGYSMISEGEHPSATTYSTTSEEEQQSAMREEMSRQTGFHAWVPTQRAPPPLNGHPWCSDSPEGTPEAIRQEKEMVALLRAETQLRKVSSLKAAPPKRSRRVALLFHGAAFRARNFVQRSELDCAPGTKQVQQQLVANHLEAVVEPIEELGFAAEIFLAHTPCSYEDRFKVLMPSEDPLGSLKLLEAWYGQRVKGTLSLSNASRHMNMYTRLGLQLLWLREAALARGPYEYFVVWRFDIALDLRFSSLIKTKEGPHNGLSFFVHAHDWMFALPGEMWNCMWHFWAQCVTYTGGSDLTTVGLDDRGGHDCFTFGPLQLEPWNEPYGFKSPLIMIQRATNPFGSPFAPTLRLDRGGTTAIDSLGRNHSCMTGWYWPPINSWENDYMPTYYHIAAH